MKSFAFLAFNIASQLYAVNVVVWYNESGVGLVCLCGVFGCFGLVVFFM